MKRAIVVLALGLVAPVSSPAVDNDFAWTCYVPRESEVGTTGIDDCVCLEDTIDGRRCYPPGADGEGSLNVWTNETEITVAPGGTFSLHFGARSDGGALEGDGNGDIEAGCGWRIFFNFAEELELTGGDLIPTTHPPDPCAVDEVCSDFRGLLFIAAPGLFGDQEFSGFLVNRPFNVLESPPSTPIAPCPGDCWDVDFPIGRAAIDDSPTIVSEAVSSHVELNFSVPTGTPVGDYNVDVGLGGFSPGSNNGFVGMGVTSTGNWPTAVGSGVTDVVSGARDDLNDSIAIHVCADADGDLICDSADNCLHVSNSDQQASPQYPDVGCACLCGDVTPDCSVNVADTLEALRAGLVPPLPPLDPDTDICFCDLNQDGLCNVADGSEMQRAGLVPPLPPLSPDFSVTECPGWYGFAGNDPNHCP